MSLSGFFFHELVFGSVLARSYLGSI